MARSELTYELVSDACHSLFKDGTNVTFDAVYTSIGRKGSAKIVTEHIARWKKDIADQLYVKRTSPVLSETLISEADQLMANLWQRALNEAHAAYAERQAELDDYKDRLEAERDQVVEAAAGLERQIHVLDTELAASAATISGLYEQINERDVRLAALAASLAERDAQLVSVRDDLARITATAEIERTQYTDELARERTRHDLAQAEERRRHDLELAQLRLNAQSEQERAAEVARGERNFLMQQTDSIRTAAQQKETHLAELLATEKLYSEQFKRQAAAGRDEASVARGKVELLQEQLAAAIARAEAAERQLPLVAEQILEAPKPEEGLPHD